MDRGSRVPRVTWAICRELNREKTALWRMELAEESPRGVGTEGLDRRHGLGHMLGARGLGCEAEASRQGDGERVSVGG